MARLPVIGGDNGTWGTELNTFLDVAHNTDGTLDPAEATLAGKVAASTVTTKGDIIAATASATVTRRAVGTNGASLVANSANSDGLAYEFNPQFYPTYKSGNYYFASSPQGTSTSNTLGNSVFRSTPYIVTKAVTITRIGAEFTAAGEANSIFRLGIYADDGTGVPTGAAVLDAGSISTGSGNAGTVATGGTPGCYEITISQALTPGVYHFGGAVQGAPTTQPTMRIIAGTSIALPIPLASIPAVNSQTAGFSMSSVSGALPTWSGVTTISAATRVFFKVS
jgi:hypothetical protein